MRTLGLLPVLLLFSACDQSANIGTSRSQSAPSPAEAPVPPSIISAQGWGPVRIGTLESVAIDAMGGARPGAAASRTDCHYVQPIASDSIRVLIEAGKVSRIEAHGGTDHVITDTGLSLGATAAQVRAKYSAELEEDPVADASAPAAYLTYWNRTDRQGIRFVVGSTGLVETILVGGPSIRNAQGCS